MEMLFVISWNNSLLKFTFSKSTMETRTMCEICPEVTIKTQERHYRGRSGLFVINFEEISHIALVFPVLTLNK